MRTEKEVLKDFEKLGYEVKENTNFDLRLETTYFRIEISKRYKDYTTYYEDSKFHSTINLNEHKLLHELFTIWGWL